MTVFFLSKNTSFRFLMFIFCFLFLVKPLQSGSSMLDATAAMPGLFCKYIDLRSENFIPIQWSSLKVFLTVSWGQENFTEPNEASASWSENVSVNGFKACVVVAGRHLNSDFKFLPSVHWVVLQDEFLKNREPIALGTTVLDTWYTGTQCKNIHFNHIQNTSLNVIASVEHPKRNNFQNAMTVWTEVTRHQGWYSDYENIRICARELQNFDGAHKDIKVVSTFYSIKHATSF